VLPQPRETAPAGERLRIAPDVRRRRARARLAVLGVALVTIASVFTLVAFHVFAVQSAFTLDRLSKERTNEQLRYERLRDEVARASSPAAVIAAASRRGMTFADSEQFLKAPPAAPRDAADPAPQSLSSATYDETKKALDQNP